MKKDTVIQFENPAKKIVEDALTGFIRESAQKMLHKAIESEVAEFMLRYEDEQLSNGHKRLVRNGYHAERTIQTGVGSLELKVPRVRDRDIGNNEKIEFTSKLVPKYMRRTVTLDVLLPILYLKGVSTGDFPDALAPLLGE